MTRYFYLSDLINIFKRKLGSLVSTLFYHQGWINLRIKQKNTQH